MKLYDTLAGELRDFEPVTPGKVRMYNCGPTVYKRAHLGNFRAYMMADLLRRTLEYLGYDVHQTMNITDVGHLTEDDVADAQGEDKLQREAALRKVDPYEIARAVEDEFHDDRRVLRIKDADEYPRATEHVPEMIAMIEALIEKGQAYEVAGNVYFRVDSFPNYGALSGNTTDKLEAGASGRVDDRDDKESPHDFALWKHDPKHLMQWDSPWGRGFPGWHIECSAMSRKYLGDTLDIHSGGPDNIFPHHECEIAQSESFTGKPFVRFWAHCGWLTIGGDKMAKRAGTMYVVPDLVEMGYDGADIRLYLIKQHYRKPLPFDLDLLNEAKKIRARFNNFVHHEMVGRASSSGGGGGDDAAIDALIGASQAEFRAALEDDINTSKALAVLHDFMTAVNKAVPDQAAADAAVAFLREADSVFEILDEAPAGDLDADIEALIQERNEARSAKDFARSDAIRDQLLSQGIELIDTPQGTRFKRI